MIRSTITPEGRKRMKRYNLAAWIFTVIVWLLVGAMRQIRINTSLNLDFLAGFNAICNTGVTIALVCAYYFIRLGRVTQHRRCIYAAMILSAGFLLSYVGYHITHDEIPFCGTGAIRLVYLAILSTHILLAGLSLPFILLTFIRGFLGDYDTHRKWARRVYPVWLYVAITGPVVYLFLSSCR